MDDKTTIQDLKKQVKKFCEDRDWDKYHNPKDLAIGIITEASELLEHFRFKSEDDIKRLLESKKQEVSEELADVLYFVLRLAQKHDIDLATELGKKLRKNELKYPINKSKSSNRKYNELK